MGFSIILPITGILCFLIAIIFFRKRKVPVSKIFFPLMTSLYSPHRMKEDIKPEGIFIIILGYILLVTFIFLFVRG